MTQFSQLKADVAEFYPHSDYTETLLNTFTTLCEAEIRRKLKVLPMEVSETYLHDEQSTPLPERWVTFKSLTLDATYKRDMDYFPPHRFRSSGVLDSGGGEPTVYTIEGRNLVIAPFSAPVTLHRVYVQMYPSLSGPSDSNDTLASAYDLYLYGTLKHAAIWAKDLGATNTYNAMFSAAIAELNKENRWARVSGDKLARTGGRTP